MAAPLVIFLHHSDWESRYQATTLAVTAAALGDSVHLALFFGALRAWVEDRFDEGAPPEALVTRVAGLRIMIEEARRDLGLRVVACETAVRLAGMEAEGVSPALDGIVSLPSLWRLAQEGKGLAL